jgi:Ctr copper transporter family
MMRQSRNPATTASVLLLLLFLAHPINAVMPVSTTTTPQTCFENPTQESCRTFTMPDQDITTQVTGLCKDMPSMVGCSLWNSCKNNSSSGLYCQEMSIYGTICEEMSEMTDCTPYNQLCFTPGSVVEQCQIPGPLPGAMSTAKTVQAVLEMCSSHSMVGCEECTGRSRCPNPLETLSKLCHGMPSMSQCAGFFTMCSNKAVESTFEKICDEDDNNHNQGLPPMKMWMHAGTYDILLFKEWIPQNTAEYVGYCIMCIVAAVVVQGLKAWRVRLEARWASKYRIACCETATCGTAPLLVPPSLGGDDEYKRVSEDKRSGSAASSEEELSIATTGGAGLSASTSNNSRAGNAIAATAPPCCGGNSNIAAGPNSNEITLGGAIPTTSTSGTNNLRRRRRNLKNKNQGDIAVGSGGGIKSRWQFILPSSEQLLRNIIRGAFTFIVVFLDYMLMLLVMSFNIGIIFSTVAGFALGAIIFGHWGERVGSGSVVAVGDLAPDSENDLEVHFMEAQTCCNSRHV